MKYSLLSLFLTLLLLGAILLNVVNANPWKMIRESGGRLFCHYSDSESWKGFVIENEKSESVGYIVDFETSRKIKLQVFSSLVNYAQFSNNGRYLLTAGIGGLYKMNAGKLTRITNASIQIWDASSGLKIATLNNPNIRAVGWSYTDGNAIYYLDDNGDLGIFEILNGEVREVFRVRDKNITQVYNLKDYGLIIVGLDEIVKYNALKDQRVKRTFPVTGLLERRQGGVSFCSYGRLIEIDWKTSEILNEISFPSAIYAAKSIGEGELLMALNGVLVDYDYSNKLVRESRHVKSSISFLYSFPDKKRLFVIDEDCFARVISSEQLCDLFSFQDLESAFFKDGGTAFAANTKFQTIRVYRNCFPEWWWGRLYRGEFVVLVVIVAICAWVVLSRRIEFIRTRRIGSAPH
jgi:WD40 repeat protein